MMYESVQRSAPCQVVAFDLGMTDDQLALTQSKPFLKVLPLPRDRRIKRIQEATRFDPPLPKQRKRLWPLWICPILIEYAPFDDVYWLDCDILVLRNLGQMFEELDRGPVFTPENKAPEVTANDPKLYEHAKIDRTFYRNRPLINAGVSGWRKSRDKEVLQAYLWMVERATEDSVIRGLISWHDQGCLIWAIQKTGVEDRVVDTFDWNLSVDNTLLKGNTIAYEPGFLDSVRELVPDAAIVHWNGCKLPWTDASPSSLAAN